MKQREREMKFKNMKDDKNEECGNKKEQPNSPTIRDYNNRFI